MKTEVKNQVCCACGDPLPIADKTFAGDVYCDQCYAERVKTCPRCGKKNISFENDGKCWECVVDVSDGEKCETDFVLVESITNLLRPVWERMRLKARLHERTDPLYAEILYAFAKDIENSVAEYIKATKEKRSRYFRCTGCGQYTTENGRCGCVADSVMGIKK